MDITEAVGVSELLDQPPENGKGHIHVLKRQGDTYQSAYEAGLANGKEEGYRRGYREGFADCYKLGASGRSTVTNREPANGTPIKTGTERMSRLRGLPCAKCGCASYVDEVRCPSCGIPKETPVGEQPAVVEGAPMTDPRNRRGRRRP
jgi:hypothetical protein